VKFSAKAELSRREARALKNDGFGAYAERKRLQEIDEIAPAINDHDLVREAKYGDFSRGIMPYSAEKLALKAAQRQAKKIRYADVDAGVAAAKKGRGGI